MSNKVIAGFLVVNYSTVGKIEKIPFYQGDNMVGRNPTNSDVTIKDTSVSQKHAKISCKDNKITIIDVGSKNGVYMNIFTDSLIRNKQYTLEDGQTIIFGQVKCKVEIAEKEAKTQDKVQQQSLKSDFLEELLVDSKIKQDEVNKNEETKEEQVQLQTKKNKKESSKGRIANNRSLRDDQDTKKDKEGRIDMKKQEQKEKQKQKQKNKEKEKNKEKQKQKQKEKERINNDQKQKQKQKSQKQNKIKYQKQQLKRKKQKDQSKDIQKKKQKEKRQDSSESDCTKPKQKIKKSLKSNDRKKKPISIEKNQIKSFYPKRNIPMRKIIFSGFKLSFTPSHLFTIVDNMSQEYDVLVMENFCRTFKLLYTICKGLPVVSMGWLIQSQYKKKIQNYEKYPIIGAQKNTIYNSIQKVNSGFKIFENLIFFLSSKQDSYHLNLSQIQMLIYIGGGEVLNEIQLKKQKKDYKNLIGILSMKYNKNQYLNAFKWTHKIYTIEMLLDSCLRQEINWKVNQIIMK